MANRSTFAERFEFARARQHILGTWQSDQALAGGIGVSPAQITDYKSREDAPAAARTLAIAKLCGVDPGWLAFGEASKAPSPDGWATWLENRRAKLAPKSSFRRTDVEATAKRRKA